MTVTYRIKRAPRVNAKVGLDGSEVPIVWIGGRWEDDPKLVSLVSTGVAQGWLSKEVEFDGSERLSQAEIWRGSTQR